MPEPTAPPTWRVLFVAPFPPRLDGRHGGSRAIAQFLVRLAERHEVALAVLRAPDEPHVDESVKRACDVVAEVELPSAGESFRARAANRLRLRMALLRGLPTWAAERATEEFGERLERLVREWRPDIVQLEYRIMGQFLPALRGATAKTVLVEHDPRSVRRRFLASPRAAGGTGLAVSSADSGESRRRDRGADGK